MDILDTLDKCKNDYKWMVEESTNHFYPDEYFTVPRIKKFPGKANILLERISTVEAIQLYSKNKMYAVLNFASAKNPGGGVLKGHNAQEESLCKASSLYPMIYQCDEFYNPRPIDPYFTDRIIYTDSVYFFKNDYGQYINPIKCDVITCAAPSYAFYDYNRVDPLEHEEVITRRFTKVLMSAIENGRRNIILGAWGCGVFGNPPDINSGVFRNVLDEYYNSFDDIIFAIPDFKNYDIFGKYLFL